MLIKNNLTNGENINIIIKKHGIVYFFLVFYIFIGILISYALLFFLENQILAYLILVIFWQIFLVFLYIELINYELDIFIITNDKIIYLKKIGFIDRHISECPLSEIKEVKAYTKGLLQNLLDYGTITIITTSNILNFQIIYAPDIISTAKNINNLANIYKEKNNHLIK